jgi:hypothetical protein
MPAFWVEIKIGVEVQVKTTNNRGRFGFYDFKISKTRHVYLKKSQ